MTPYDYGALAFYFVFLVLVSWVFRTFVRDASDYFRSGGRAVWWMVGGSAFMVAFSAWTFTAAAGSAYTDGWPIIILYVGNVVGFLINATYFGAKFRQIRVVTSVEAVRLRFGRRNEQLFTWLQIPLGTLIAGVWLNALGVFFSAVFGWNLNATITLTGSLVLCIALLGGSWSVLASDFIQVLVLMPVACAVTVLVLLRIGGFSVLFERLPSAHTDLRLLFSRDFLLLWAVAMVLKAIVSTNNLLEASRYLCVKDSRHARWAGFLGAGLFTLGIVIWFVPPMAARVLYPDLRAVFPHLANPSEAAFIATARAVLPVGMMGLLAAGIFAATMSAMDAGLNKNAGIFLKNFYQPRLRPNATEAHLLLVGKTATVVLGIIVILVALKLSHLRELNLFLQMQRVTILVANPIIVPLLLGLIIRRTPSWSAWSAVLAGSLYSFFFNDLFPPDSAARFFGRTTPLDAVSREYWTQGIQFVGIAAVCTLWMLGTRLFWKRTSDADRTQVETFFQRFDKPVRFDEEQDPQRADDDRQSRTIGWLCIVYGGFVALLSLIPNPLLGRGAFVFCGGFVISVGVALIRSVRPLAAPPPAVALSQ